MRIREALREAERLIAAMGSNEAALEAELLVMHASGLDRSHLYQRLDDALPAEQAEVLEEYVARRLKHEPVPYITASREFFALEFEVAPCALIPRPETETLVELAIAFAEERFAGARFTMADIGTGSGIIAVSVAHELPNARVIATDVEPGALALARRNAEAHGMADRIDFRAGDLLEPVVESVDVIAANLPYVATTDWEALPPEIREYEPRTALDGGSDGVRAVGRLLQQAPGYLRPGGALFEEIGDTQGAAAVEMAQTYFPGAAVGVEKDLSGLDRVLTVRTAAG